jgi:hypothetical protein
MPPGLPGFSAGAEVAVASVAGTAVSETTASVAAGLAGVTVEVEQPVSPRRIMPRSVVNINRLPTDKIKLFEFIFCSF